ncbi:hypothetical protein BANRA_04032 [Acinetobacter baumannii]|nr:hypothetical protein BANRA_04032 [Acinetobacter baumannii]
MWLKQQREKVKNYNGCCSVFSGFKSVDTGAYRASHIVSIGSGDYGIREPETNPVNDAAIQAVKIKLGNLVYIQNNQPYAERLENGWSDQAPQGIYGLTFNFISQKYGG